VKEIRIATRKSPLALWQARHVAELVAGVDPSAETRLVEMTTDGDRFLDAPLSAVGGKGLFVKEIEQALLDGRADIAVHSLKDMTSQLPDGLLLGAFPKREDPRDAWISPLGLSLQSLPENARVGTSSLRRACQLLEKRPRLEIIQLRGNVQTRLQKTESSQLAGTMLALAGLKRLGLDGRVTQILEPEESLPAVGQGILAVQCRVGDERVLRLLRPLDDAPTRAAVDAERALLAVLEGGCTVPLAGYAEVKGGQVHLRGLIGRPDGSLVLRAQASGPISSSAQLGREVGQALLARGARAILESIGAQRPGNFQS
jgi:hydroxymethylbilane synthase